MQSGYGVPEIPQFMVDGSFSSLLQHQQQQPQRFHHLESIPITQQFFQQQQHQQFLQTLQQQQQQRRLHQQLGLDIKSVLENSNSPSRIIGSSDGGPGVAFLSANFKLATAANENSGSREALNDDDPIVTVGGEDVSDSRTTVTVHPWKPHSHREEDSSMKEPFWKPLDAEYMNRNNKSCMENMESSRKFSKKSVGCNGNEEGKNTGSNYGLFGELEAIYAHGGVVGVGGNNQTGSGSALTGDNNLPPTAVVRRPGAGPSSGIDHGSETSNGEEASLKNLQKKRRKKKQRKQLGSIATFFESLVKQLMDHQESLHQKFLEVMERKDQERTDREEAWREQEASKSSREAIARTAERAIVASREATIIAFLEKITGERISFPNTTQIQISSQLHEEPVKENPIEQPNTLNMNSNYNIENNMNMTNTRRWPKAEVQALIRVRSSLESKFQEPGLKGPLWEEVCSSMASMGYQRSAKRCKEKWENINKYFRKTKDTAKKRSQHSKTCPYFHQLHQLYSKSSYSSPPTLPSAIDEERQPLKDGSQLLDSTVVAPPNDQVNEQNQSLDFVQKQIDNLHRTYKFTEMVSMGLDNESDNANEGSRLKAGKHVFENEVEYEEDNGDDGDDSGDDAVEGEGENQEHMQNEGIGVGKHHQKPMFFCLES